MKKGETTYWQSFQLIAVEIQMTQALQLAKILRQFRELVLAQVQMNDVSQSGEVFRQPRQQIVRQVHMSTFGQLALKIDKTQWFSTLATSSNQLQLTISLTGTSISCIRLRSSWLSSSLSLKLLVFPGIFTLDSQQRICVSAMCQKNSRSNTGESNNKADPNCNHGEIN